MNRYLFIAFLTVLAVLYAIVILGVADASKPVFVDMQLPTLEVSP